MTKTHGMTGTPTYRSWRGMRRRCSNPDRADYKHYGGRGIKVCAHWHHSFENFLADMGVKPEGLTLERKDVNKDYSKENCKWATISEQRRNIRKTKWFYVGGVKMSLHDAAEAVGLKPNTLWNRVKRGRSHQEALGPESTGRY